MRWTCAGGDVEGTRLVTRLARLTGIFAWRRADVGCAVAQIKADTARVQARNKEDAEHLDADIGRRAKQYGIKPSR